MSIEREFIPYEQALYLKELGFNEPCLSRYCRVTEWEVPTGKILFQLSDCELNEKNLIKAPTFSQAFRWFREKYGLHTWITSKTNDKGETVFIPQGRTIPDTIKNNLTVDIIPYYTGKSSEEAELECLKKLISIVKRK